jgi:hypothetical protein
MYNAPKYIVVDDGLEERAIVFSNELVHADVAFSYKRQGSVVAAGFVHIFPEGIEVFGKSESLKIGCRGLKDPEIIRRSLYLMWMKEQ